MSAARSPSTHRIYGVSRVCRLWQLARSGLYAARQRREAPAALPGKPGPKTKLSDDELLREIRKVLKQSVGALGRRPSEGLGATSGSEDDGLPRSRSSTDARERPVGSYSQGASQRSEGARRYDHDERSRLDVGNRCDAHLDAPGWPGLDLRRRGSLHERLCRDPRIETGESLRSPGAGHGCLAWPGFRSAAGLGSSYVSRE